MTNHTRRVRRLAPTTVALLALALAGCAGNGTAQSQPSAAGAGTGRSADTAGTASGTGDDDAHAATPGPSSDAAEPATPDAAAFPVTIDSALGQATIPAPPSRVVTWGWSAQDAALALGVVPTAMPAYTYGGNADQVLPWDAERLAQLGAPTPTLLASSDSGQVPLEQIAAAGPDVVLAPYSGLTSEEFATLSALAPVVAYPDQPWATSWQDVTTIVGQALGMQDKARDLVADTQRRVAQYAAANPGLAGKTFMYAAANQADQLNVYRAADPRVQLLVELGMQVAPSVESLNSDPGAGSYFYQLSYENLADIDADILVMYFGSQDEADTFLADPRVAALPQVKEGRFAAIVGEALVMATSAPSVLSIPWSMDRYVPILAAAAAKAG